MTALRLTNSTPVTAADPTPPGGWSHWLMLDQAAGLLGISPGRLRGKAPKLASQGHAIKAHAPGQSRDAWWISRKYDARLWQGEAGRKQQAPDLGQLSAKNRDLVMQRSACLDRFRAAKASDARPVKQWLPELVATLQREFPGASVSRSHLYEWDKLIRNPADLIELADGRGGDQYADRYAEFWKRFQREFLDPNQPKVKHSYEAARMSMREEGLAPKSVPSLRTVHRQLDERIPPATQAFHRDRDGEYKQKFLPNIEQDIERFAAGRCWVFDHTKMDMWCRQGERVFRPWLTTAMDWRTRKIVGWCLGLTPHSDTILLCLREGLLDGDNMGGPEHVAFDNGKDFDSWIFDGRTKQQRRRKVQNDWLADSSFRGIFGALKIEPHFSIAYAPNGKSRKERWYGTLHDQFDRTFTTYAGKDPMSQPAGLNERLADLKQVPTYEHVHARLSDYIDAYNRRDDHQIQDLAEDGIRLSPAQAMAAWCDTRRMFGEDDEHHRQVLDLLLMHHERPVSVGKSGVRVTVAGKAMHYGLKHGVLLPELRGYQGRVKKKVRAAYDPRDLSAVHIYDDATGQLLCIAENNRGEQGGRQRVAESHRAIRQYHKDLKAVGMDKVIPKQSMLERQLMSGDLPEAPEPATKSVKPVRTGFDDAAKQAQRHQMKKAAGAEHRSENDDPAKGIYKPKPIAEISKLLNLSDPRNDQPAERRAAATEPDPDDNDTSPIALIGMDNRPEPMPAPPVLEDEDADLNPLDLLARLR